MVGVVLRVGLALIALGAATLAIAQEEGEPSTLLVEVVAPARMIGFPAVCPGTSAEENQADIICVAELYESDVRVLRNIGGAKTAHRLRIRFTAHSFHAVWKKDVRFLLVAAPFDDEGNTGHFAHYWLWENKDGLFCREEDEAADEENGPLRRLYAGRSASVVPTESNEWPEGTQLICVTGNEVLRD